MSDLISRKETYNELIESIDWLRERDYELYCVIGDSIRVCLDEQPTAFDVDKVVEELLALNKNYNFGINMYEEVVEIPTEDVIEIVKQGGVNDDVCEWKIVDRPHNLPIYNTSCGKIRMQYTTGFDIYCNGCGKKIKVVESDNNGTME